ncbi:hypothetical protein E3C22_11570 [Jiella endophytica]|uniref:DUF4760 domain-containing protein n=1 Tax=Jiella endophytica TaxID=2558362 RepID=A0A4Y8RJ94_9HYPH|nr:hypothetical protein [Jiella endophytica]TFF23074.1 hypothetical protein E3C22_11570 [Jiella endophytica]
MPDLLLPFLGFAAAPAAAPEPGFWGTVFSKDSLLGAAILAVAAWVGKTIYQEVRDHLRATSLRREAAMRAYFDVKSRLESLVRYYDPEVETRYVGLIEESDRPNRPFRFFSVYSRSENSYPEFRKVLHHFDPRVIETFQAFTQYSELLDAQFQKFSTGEFEALSTARKVQAIRVFFQTARLMRAPGGDFLFYLLMDRQCQHKSFDGLDGSPVTRTVREDLSTLDELVRARGARRHLLAFRAVADRIARPHADSGDTDGSDEGKDGTSHDRTS